MIANRPIGALAVELWWVFPTQPSEPALPAARRHGLFCQPRISSEIHNLALMIARCDKDAG